MGGISKSSLYFKSSHFKNLRLQIREIGKVFKVVLVRESSFSLFKFIIVSGIFSIFTRCNDSSSNLGSFVKEFSKDRVGLSKSSKPLIYKCFKLCLVFFLFLQDVMIALPI